MRYVHHNLSSFFQAFLSKNTCLILVLSFISIGGRFYAQGPASICYFGRAALDFRTLPPTPLTNSAIVHYSEGTASICDENGELLFYSNGGNSALAPGSFGAVYNKYHEVMENGELMDSAGCFSSYQGIIAVPFPKSNRDLQQNLYYLFTRDCLESSFNSAATNDGLTYSVIDMNANNGAGKVISKFNSLVPYQVNGGQMTVHEPLAAIQHANGKDYWLFSYTLNKLHRLLVTENGISDFHLYEDIPFEPRGRIVISPAKNFLCTGKSLFAFNPENAALNFIGDFSDDNVPAFSSNGKLIYAIENKVLYQYNLENPNIFGSRTLIANLNNNYQLYLSPNAMIYLFASNTSNLPGVIRCANSIGASCNFSMLPTSLNGMSCGLEFTNVMPHYLYYDGPDCAITTVNEIDASQANIFPNPNDGNFNIHWPKGFMGDIDIYALNGQLISRQKVLDFQNKIQLQVHHPGVYIIQFLDALRNHTYHKKLIIH
ncbi:MAG: T9SS type A sorting domain-containing protein [Flavobacteriales bacterium]